jgi:hypothetical protein
MADADGKNPTERENLLMQKRKEELFWAMSLNRTMCGPLSQEVALPLRFMGSSYSSWKAESTDFSAVPSRWRDGVLFWVLEFSQRCERLSFFHLVLFWDRVLLTSPGWLQSCIHLPQLLKCWDYRSKPCLASMLKFLCQYFQNMANPWNLNLRHSQFLKYFSWIMSNFSVLFL